MCTEHGNQIKLNYVECIYALCTKYININVMTEKTYKIIVVDM